MRPVAWWLLCSLWVSVLGGPRRAGASEGPAQILAPVTFHLSLPLSQPPCPLSGFLCGRCRREGRSPSLGYAWVQANSAQSGLLGYLEHLHPPGAQPPSLETEATSNSRFNPWESCHRVAACSNPPKTEIQGFGETKGVTGWGAWTLGPSERCWNLQPHGPVPKSCPCLLVLLRSPSASSPGAAGLSMPSKIFLGSVGSALASLMV